jgi:hypothetical protein
VSGPEVPKKLSAHTLTTPTADEDIRITVATVIVSAVPVALEFFIFAILVVIFVANSDSLCITMIITPVSLSFMQIDSVGL